MPTGQDDHDYQMKMWDAYISRKKMLDAAGLEIADRYTKWLITISGGALFVSLTFLEKFAPHPRSSTTGLLAGAWVLLAVSMLGAFIAIYFSGRSIQRQLALAEYRHRRYKKSQDATLPDVPLEDEQNCWGGAIVWIDLISVGALVSGLACLCLFAFLNLPTGKSSETPQHSVFELRLAGEGTGASKTSLTNTVVLGGSILNQLKTLGGDLISNAPTQLPSSNETNLQPRIPAGDANSDPKTKK